MNHRRAKVLGALLLALAIGAIAAVPAMAAETPSEAAGGPIPTAPEAEAATPEAEEASSASKEGTSTAVEAVPLSPLSLGQCEQGTICIWGANDWEGNFSWWAGQNTGCQNHPGNPEIRSLWNRTGFTAELQGYGQIPSGERFTRKGVFTGYLCW